MMTTPTAHDLIPAEFRGHARGAIRNGARVVKVFAEEGDRNEIGTLGSVLSSLEIPAQAFAEMMTKTDDERGAPFMYFVEWDSMPGIPVAVRAAKLVELKTAIA